MSVGQFLPPVLTRLSMNIDDFVAKVSKAKAALSALDGKVDIPVDINAAPAVAALKTVKGATDDATTSQRLFAAALDGTNSQLNAQAAALNTVNPGITSMSRRLATATAWQERFQSAVQDTNAALERQGAAAAAAGLGRTAAADGNRAGGGGGGAWWGALGGTVPLFAGMATIGVWHVAFDAALESAIALTGAMLDLTAAAAAMAPAAQDIYTNFKSIHTVSVALGINGIGPLTGQFERLQHAVAPQTIEAYGAALNLVNKQGSGLNQVITNVVDGFDGWLAKLNIFASGRTGGLSHLMQSGLGFLHQFEAVTNNLGVGLSNLVKAEPGTAHYLMDIVVGASAAIRAFTNLPSPILKSVLAFHSIYLWGGLAVTAMNWVGTKAVALYRPLAALSALILANPSIAVGGGILAGLGYFIAQASKLPTAVQGQISNFDSFMSNTTPSGALTGMNQWIGQFSREIPGAMRAATNATRSYETTAHASLTDLAQAFGANGTGPGGFLRNLVGGAENFGKAVYQFFPSMTAASQQWNAVKAYESRIHEMTGAYSNLFHESANLMGQNYSLNQSFGLMSMAGVKTTDTFQVMKAKVDNLITGYNAMSVTGGLLMNSVNAVTFAAEQQNQQISQVTQGWTAFINLITGGAGSFATFEQQMIGLMQTSGTMATNISVANGKVSASSTLAGVASIGGISSAQLQQLQTYVSAIQDASSTYNQLLMLANAARMGAAGVSLLGQAGKDMVAQFLPAAQGSRLLTEMLYGLAQQAGYRGADSFQKLAQWVGNVKNPSQQLLSIITTLTGRAGNLAQDVNNLANAINSNLNSAMAQAITAAGGGNSVFAKFADTFMHNQSNATALASSAGNLIEMLIRVTGNTTASRTEFEAWASWMGIAKGKAEQLWNDLAASGGRTTPKVVADIAQIQAAWDRLQSKTLTLNVVTSGSIPGVTATAYGPYSGGYRLPPAAAKGYASGTPGAARGWAWVGEKGPELVNFHGGESVIPHGVARGYANGTGDLVLETHNHFHVNGREIFKEVQRQSVNSQRRTGTNGLGKRTR